MFSFVQRLDTPEFMSECTAEPCLRQEGHMMLHRLQILAENWNFNTKSCVTKSFGSKTCHNEPISNQQNNFQSR